MTPSVPRGAFLLTLVRLPDVCPLPQGDAARRYSFCGWIHKADPGNVSVQMGSDGYDGVASTAENCRVSHHGTAANGRTVLAPPLMMPGSTSSVRLIGEHLGEFSEDLPVDADPPMRGLVSEPPTAHLSNENHSTTGDEDAVRRWVVLDENISVSSSIEGGANVERGRTLHVHEGSPTGLDTRMSAEPHL